MKIAVTGATGFLGRHIVNRLLERAHQCYCWYRPTSDRGGFNETSQSVTWIEGGLEQPNSIGLLLQDVDAVVHAGLYYPMSGTGHRGAGSVVAHFAEVSIISTLRLIEAAHQQSINRFIFISTCGVHDVILEDHALDETHPLWPLSHYGAHKAAIEKFVHSFGIPRAAGPSATPTHKHLTPQILCPATLRDLWDQEAT